MICSKKRKSNGGGTKRGRVREREWVEEKGRGRGNEKIIRLLLFVCTKKRKRDVRKEGKEERRREDVREGWRGSRNDRERERGEGRREGE